MPIMDGNESTQKIREYLYSKDLKQPVICGLTGHVEPSYVKRSIQSGMNCVFSKPVNMELLKNIISKLRYDIN